MFMTDLARRAAIPVQLEFMAVSFIRSATSSRRVRILKDLDRDIAGRHVLIVEDIIDSAARCPGCEEPGGARPASLEVCALLRSPMRSRWTSQSLCRLRHPERVRHRLRLDYAERYRDLPFIGTLDPGVYA